MTEQSKKAGYEAPKMEAVGFKVEQGYAASVGAKIGMGKATIA